MPHQRGFGQVQSGQGGFGTILQNQPPPFQNDFTSILGNIPGLGQQGIEGQALQGAQTTAPNQQPFSQNQQVGFLLANLLGQGIQGSAQGNLDAQAFQQFTENQKIAQGTLMDRINEILNSPFLQDLRTRGADLLNLQTTNPQRAANLQQANVLQEQAVESLNADLARRGLGGGSGEEGASRGAIGRAFADIVLQQNAADVQRGENLTSQAFQFEQNALAPLLQQLAAMQAQQPAFRGAAGLSQFGALAGAGIGAAFGGAGGAAIGGSLGGSIGSLF